MDNKLRFQFELSHNIQQNETNSEIWGCISISLLTDHQLVSLLQTQWDLSGLKAWFEENQDFIRSEVLSIDGSSPLPSESLAQALNRLQEKEFSENEQDAEDHWFDALFEFRQRHSLRFALRGANIPEIIIGYHRGAGEISLSNREDDWSYLFDMDDFISDLRQKLIYT
ncbi:hypothetical protein HJG54_34250 [Leptolyngbya sp. NK1-12]|uniref:Uncharacterized protein n=1 Tax=Leptolyngbya sp. NK1-12 TaxID=2547451 RepID=A0AA97ASY9_9CYAN|nr:hypothetical protein [Leptolyngbya sp. NK1-12]WNZ26899.1 hypothetical protein HJG54_28650 [Leptolyngbya sp. NK1-12]WNZ27888.1 hypothetical protein HJG54_34250 [Leptolyngbya sp. NK1-12]